METLGYIGLAGVVISTSVLSGVIIWVGILIIQANRLRRRLGSPKTFTSSEFKALILPLEKEAVHQVVKRGMEPSQVKYWTDSPNDSRGKLFLNTQLLEREKLGVSTIVADYHGH